MVTHAPESAVNSISSREFTPSPSLASRWLRKEGSSSSSSAPADLPSSESLPMAKCSAPLESEVLGARVASAESSSSAVKMLRRALTTELPRAVAALAPLGLSSDAGAVLL